MKEKYVDENDFKDFKQNFNLMIQTFNHSVSDIKASVVEMRTDVREIKQTQERVSTDLAELKGQYKVSMKVLWWIMGILAGAVAVGLGLTQLIK